MILEYLKKHSSELFDKILYSVCILLITLLVIAAILACIPSATISILALVTGLLHSFGLIPACIFWVGVFFLSVIAAISWLIIEQKLDTSTPILEGEYSMSDEKEDALIPLQTGKPSTDILILSKLNKKRGEISEAMVENTTQEDANFACTLEAYSNESTRFISSAKNAILNKTFRNPDVFNPLEKDFKALKKKYYVLARNYHPDKNGNEEDFKELGQYYEAIGGIFDRLKTLHTEVDIGELLKKMDEKLAKLDEKIKTCWEILNDMKKIRIEMKKDDEEREEYGKEYLQEKQELKELISRTRYISDSEMQQAFTPFSASQPGQQEVPLTDSQKTNSSLTIGTPVASAFSNLCSSVQNSWSWKSIFSAANNSDANDQQKAQGSEISKQISLTKTDVS